MAYTNSMVAAPSLRGLPFDNGDVMMRQEFHRLYAQCESLERVELVEGVVYLPSPIRLRGQAAEQRLIFEWLMAYTAAHPTTSWLPNTTLKLDDLNEVEPDALLLKGQPETDDEGYLAQVPELVVEIAHSSRARDFHQKKTAYERNGVGEYIVWDTRDSILYWFCLADEKYEELEPLDGAFESRQFEDLQLPITALLTGDVGRLRSPARS